MFRSIIWTALRAVGALAVVATGLVALTGAPAGAATAPSFAGSSTFTGTNGLPSFSYTQSLSIPDTPCSLSLTESGSAGNAQWDWPMHVAGDLGSAPAVGQSDSGGMTVTPQSPAGDSYQISVGVGLSLSVCGIGASTGLGIGAATTAPAPMPGQQLDVPVTGSCPGYEPNFSPIPGTTVSIGVTVCPVTTLDGSSVGASFGGTDASVSPGSLSLSTSSSAISATPTATSFGLGLSDLSYGASLSEGLDVNVVYQACVVIVGCTSGTLYTSPTLYIVQNSAQSSTGSPSSLNFPLTAAKGTSTTTAGSSASPTYGQAGTLDATVAPSSVSDGTVTLRAGTTVVGTCTPTDGSCSVPWTPAAAGRTRVKATWSGDTDYAGSSGATVVTVAKEQSTTSLSLSAASVAAGQEASEVFTVHVGPQSTGTPSGQVAVVAGSVALCTVTLAAGHGTCSPANSALARGAYRVSARYGGNVDFLTSRSSVKHLHVT